jgi:hypothetical protein
MKIWINGHEWSKRQAMAAGIEFTELSNGFASCTDPVALQAICDRFGPEAITAFCQSWLDRLPLPLTPADRAAGYWWELSMRQVEFSRTIVFTAPRHARAFFETLVADNLDLGRPEQVEVIFGRKIRRKRRPRLHPDRRCRHHQPDPSRPHARAARRRKVHHLPGQLRPDPTARQSLIERLPGRNVSRLTPTGQRFAVFYTKLHNRLLRPLMAADRSPAPRELRQALHTIDRHIDDYLDLAGVCPASDTLCSNTERLPAKVP